MRKATPMIFRNLTRKCFSISYRGKTIADFTEGRVYMGTFHVGEAGRLRALNTGHKTVHAGIKLTPRLSATEISYMKFYSEDWGTHNLVEVTYNPKKHTAFVNKETGEPMPTDEQSIVVFSYPRIFVVQ